MAKLSQVFSADELVDGLISTFVKSGIDQFKSFLAKHPGVTKWIIACDFVLNDPGAVSDAYAYTFFPYNAEIQQVKANIQKLVPKDFKQTKNIGDEFKQFMFSGETFTICLLTPKRFNLVGDLHSARRGLDETIQNMQKWDDAANQVAVIKQFQHLRQSANANNFNVQLMSTMIVATVMAAFCAMILAQERKIEVVGWFPDRDNITTAYEGIANFLFSVDFSAFCQRYKLEHGSIRTVIGLPAPDTVNPKQSWYDELVRIPDFVAGPLAAWNSAQNLVSGRQKYVELLEGVIADNPNLIVLPLLQNNIGIQIGRAIISKTPAAAPAKPSQDAGEPASG
ncbi:MAG: hypothetical protein ACLP7P_09945 [Rhodomicrobium sp.]